MFEEEAGCEKGQEESDEMVNRPICAWGPYASVHRGTALNVRTVQNDMYAA
jgi:hypothetical protein